MKPEYASISEQDCLMLRICDAHYRQDFRKFKNPKNTYNKPKTKKQKLNKTVEKTMETVDEQFQWSDEDDGYKQLGAAEVKQEMKNDSKEISIQYANEGHIIVIDSTSGLLEMVNMFCKTADRNSCFLQVSLTKTFF